MGGLFGKLQYKCLLEEVASVGDWLKICLQLKFRVVEEGGCKATWKMESMLPWREAGPPDHHDDKVDSDEEVVNKEPSLSPTRVVRRVREVLSAQMY